MINLDEIKKRTEEIPDLKKPFTDLRWAHTTILQLCAEVERREQNFKEFYNKGLEKLKKELPDTAPLFKEIQALMTAHEVCVENEKLTAANKILDEALEKYSPHSPALDLARGLLK